jgi:hypothetical protein
MKPGDLKFIGGFLLTAILGFAAVLMVRATTQLDGIRTGRATLVLTTAVQSVRHVPQAEWSDADHKQVEQGFSAALLEAKDSVEALEWVELNASTLKLPKQETAAKALRCPLEETESAWLSIPREATRLILNKPSKVAKC